MKNRKGFTIVELVIVIAVIAILAAVLIPTFATVISKANQSNATQTAANALKAGLLMTNTAQLPKDTLILVDSDKNVSTKVDYGYKYKNGNELEQVEIYKDDNFDSALLKAKYTLLVGNGFATFTAKDGDTAASAAAGEDFALIKEMFKTATGKEVSIGFVTTDTTDTVLKNYTLLDGDSVVVCDVYTSVDMPKNVIIFVPQD